VRRWLETMDIVYIRDLRIDTFIGIYDWEQQLRQTLSIDLDMSTDVAATAAANDISLTLDYKAISDRLLGMIDNQHFELLESLAEQIALVLQDEFQVRWLRLRLGKPGAVPAAADVGIVIERGSAA
jgi:dihydroneopterin aldolase